MRPHFSDLSSPADDVRSQVQVVWRFQRSQLGPVVPCSRHHAAGRLTDANLAGIVSPCLRDTRPALQRQWTFKPELFFKTIIQAHLTEREQISKFCTTLGSMKSIGVAIHA